MFVMKEIKKGDEFVFGWVSKSLDGGLVRVPPPHSLTVDI